MTELESRERNKNWHRKVRARGICTLCKKPMNDNERRLSHIECKRLQHKGFSVKEIMETMRGS